jgi:hypothetical protein
MDNLHIYSQARAVPAEALKEIKGGRLNGKSDINPMWRIKQLTELFGPCGIGWKYTITKQWLESGGPDEIAAFVNIDLFFKHEGAWSEAIPGTGGSAFVTKEKSGPYTSDECFKMALTDAISVACKALGFGADVYWDKDRTKYGNRPQGESEKSKATPSPQATQKPPQQTKTQPPTQSQQGGNAVNWTHFWAGVKKLGYTSKQVHDVAGVVSINSWNQEQVNALFKKLTDMKEEKASA